VRGYSAPKVDALVARGTTAEQLLRHAAMLVIASETTNAYQAPRDWPKIAKTLGFDLAKVMKATPAPDKTAAPDPAAATDDQDADDADEPELAGVGADSDEEN